MSSDAEGFGARYGPWALVAGGSEGLGAEFARQLAGRGVHLALVARRPGLLEERAASLRGEFGVEVRTFALDLARTDAASAVRGWTRDLEVGLVVYNAAHSPIGEFVDLDLAEPLRALDLNCRTPLALAHAFGRDMAARQRGGILLVSSLSALQGSPLLATYAATKAFERVLAEGLWDELRGRGVDVLAFCPGATRTPRYEASTPRRPSRLAPPVMEPADVAREALDRLGSTPSAIAGRSNRVAGFVMQRLLSRRRAVTLMGRATRSLYRR